MILYDPTAPITDDELSKLSESDLFSYLDQVAASKRKDKNIVSTSKKKVHEILKSNGVKNVKTNRSQWFE